MEKYVDATSEKVRNHILDDLTFSILSKFPVKSLKRFGCARKLWSLLFENPHFMSIFRNNFISNHRSYYDDTSLLLLLRHRFIPSLYSLFGERFENRDKLDWPNPFQEEDPCFNILDTGSITGTLCLCQRNGRSRGQVVLWNPATEELKVIPPSPVESIPPHRKAWVHFHGSGYDHVRDDYKLIRYVSFDRLTDLDLDRLGMPWEDVKLEGISLDPLWEIYSLRSNSWRKLDVDVDVPNCGYDRVAGERSYMDGICHWLGGSDSHNGGIEYVVLSFDLSNEVLFTTPIPLDISPGPNLDDVFHYLYQYHLALLNGSIALISYYDCTTHFHISILGEIGVKESWTKLIIVGPLSCIERPIEVGKKGDIFFRRQDGELVLFDLRTQMIEELGVKGRNCRIVIYKESLLSIGGRNH